MESMSELLLLFFITIICCVVKIIHRNALMKRSNRKLNSSIDTMPMITHICAGKVKEIDQNFSEEKMLEWVRGLFIKLQKAWTERDWELIRQYESKSLFEQHKNQVQEYIDTNRINIRDRVTIEYAYLYKFRQEGDRDILEIALKSTMKDYIIDETTKQVLEGDKTQYKTKVYKMTFERKTGILTPKGTEKIKTTNCPNCGAPTEVISTGKCEYCGSIITTDANTWVLVALEPMKNY